MERSGIEFSPVDVEVGIFPQSGLSPIYANVGNGWIARIVVVVEGQHNSGKVPRRELESDEAISELRDAATSTIGAPREGCKIVSLGPSL